MVLMHDNKSIINSIICPIAIDMGSVNTGIYTVDIINNKLENAKRTTIIVNNTNFTLSQQKRLTTRHALRNRKRKDMAKRLIDIVCIDLFGDLYKTGNQLWIQTHRLINKRGYSYINLEPINNDEFYSDFDDLLEELKDKIDLDQSLINQLKPLITIEQKLDFLLTNANNANNTNNTYEKIINFINQDSDKKFKKLYSELKKWDNDYKKSDEEGHYHRSKYKK